MRNGIRLVLLIFIMYATSASSDHDSLLSHYTYFKDPIPLIAVPEAIAIYDESGADSPEELLNLLEPELPDPDIRRLPIPGWLIALPRSASGTPSIATVSSLIPDLIRRSDRYFFSPVFAAKNGGAIIPAPAVLIQFRSDVRESTIRRLLEAVEVSAEPEPFGGLLNGFRIDLQRQSGFEVLDIANRLARRSEVVFAEPDMIVTVRPGLIPNDPDFSECWGLHNTGQNGGTPDADIDAPEAWDVTLGDPSVIVLVLDSGVQQDHPDINQIPGNDFTNDFNSNGDGGPVNSCDTHGTLVAGVVTSVANNFIGGAGVAPGAKVASARITVSEEAPTCPGNAFTHFSYTVNALAWGQSIGSRITNNSNFFSSPSSAITTKYQETYDSGMIHFAAAGNSGTAGVRYPAHLSSVNAVSAIKSTGEKALLSSWGPEMDFTAPGISIFSTDRTGTDGIAAGDHVVVSGTSFAAPMAAGVAALLLSERPALSSAEIEQHLRMTAVDLGSAGWDEFFGWGLVNAERALTIVFLDGFESGDTGKWSSTVQ